VRLLDRTLKITAGRSASSAEIRADATAEASSAGLRELHSRGIPIALDDVTSVVQLDGAADTARGIARFAVDRGIGLVAVGIESKAMLGFARALGCVGAQGYLLGRPMASQELRRWARAGA
jgi:EAL domain-containing protein (putative c-di-GMP-specific phosphodiesterase class I)